MPLPIISTYAALLTLVYIVLVGAVGRARSRGGPSLGPGDTNLMVADRRHMNFVESVPFAVLLIALVEANGGPKGWVHALGAILLVARLIHPFGLDAQRMNTPARGVGAGGTFLVMLGAAVTLLWQVLR